MSFPFAAIGGALGGLGQFIGGASSLFGGGGGQSPATTLGQQQLQFAMDAAGKQIQWRVKDAKDAGIHPLYAMGAPAFNPTSISIPGDAPGPDIGAALSGMGQGIGRAIDAVRTKDERQESAYEMIRQSQQIERGDLENQVLRAQLASAVARLGRDQVGPPAPTPNPVTAATGQSVIKPNEITSSQGDIPHAAAGPVAPSNQWRVAPDGTVYPTPEANLQMDDMGSPGWLPWMYRNHVRPFVQQLFGQNVQGVAPPMSYLPPGATHWRKSLDGAWVPMYDSGHRVNRSRYSSGAGYGGTDPSRYRR